MAPTSSTRPNSAAERVARHRHAQATSGPSWTSVAPVQLSRSVPPCRRQRPSSPQRTSAVWPCRPEQWPQPVDQPSQKAPKPRCVRSAASLRPRGGAWLADQSGRRVPNVASHPPQRSTATCRRPDLHLLLRIVVLGKPLDPRWRAAFEMDPGRRATDRAVDELVGAAGRPGVVVAPNVHQRHAAECVGHEHQVVRTQVAAAHDQVDRLEAAARGVRLDARTRAHRRWPGGFCASAGPAAARTARDRARPREADASRGLVSLLRRVEQPIASDLGARCCSAVGDRRPWPALRNAFVSSGAVDDEVGSGPASMPGMTRAR